MSEQLRQPNTSPARTRPFSGRVSRILVCVLAVAAIGGVLAVVQSQMVPDVDPNQTKTVEVKNNGSETASQTPDVPETAVTHGFSQESIDQAEHPYDPLIEIADLCLAEIDKNYQDYTAHVISQVRIEDKLFDEKQVLVKIRHEHENNGKQIPFCVYTLFLQPKANVGQEAIWVDGWHDNKLVAHGTGLLNVMKVYLDPEGSMAMDGNRYPIWDIGIRNLMVKMKEILDHDRQFGKGQVTIKRGVEINGIKCTVLEAKHDAFKEGREFHIARMYMDDERNIPIGYEGFLWPTEEGGEPILLEKYFYTDLKFNVGLTFKDFDPDNEEYNYPSR